MGNLFIMCYKLVLKTRFLISPFLRDRIDVAEGALTRLMVVMHVPIKVLLLLELELALRALQQVHTQI